MRRVELTGASERPLRRDGAQTWWFDFVAPSADLAGWVELAWWSDERRARYVATVVGRTRRQLVVIDDEIPARSLTPSLEFRHHQIWAQHVCETPFDHWTVGLETHGVVVDSPREAVERPWGDRVALGFDVEWEALGSPVLERLGYAQRCRVTGDVLVGDEAHDLDVVGWRGRSGGADGPRWRAGSSLQVSDRWAADAVDEMVHAPAGGAHPHPWARWRSLARVGDEIGWIDWGVRPPGRPLPS